jgi:hypothetical protein
MFSYKNSLDDPLAIDLLTKQVIEEGYCKITSVLGRSEVKKYRKSIDEIHTIESKREKQGYRDKDYDYNYYNFSGTHYYNSPRRYRVFDPIIGHPFVIDLLENIMGCPCILSQTELRRPAHKKDDDYAHTFHRDGRVMVDANIWFIVFWLMNEVTENNGPTIIIPKTHRHHLGDRQEEKHQVKLTGNPGDIFVMNSNLLHKASLSRDGRSRWLFIPTYNPWFIKPSVDYTKVFTKKQFEQLTEEQKQIFGFTSIVPVDERVRIYTLRPWKEQMDDIQFRSEPYPI